MRCPKDGSACCDDLCHGAGCIEMGGYQMLAECSVCGGLVDEEIPDCSTCTCDDGESEEWNDGFDWGNDEPRGTPEFGCVLPPGECCMPGLHFPSECHTAQNYVESRRSPPNTNSTP